MLLARAKARRAYRANGYYVFRNVLAKDAIQSLLEAVEAEVLRSDAAFVRHYSASPEPNRYVHDPDGNHVVVNALLDPHGRPETAGTARAMRALICTEAVANLIGWLDGAPGYTIHQTILFFTSPETGLHFDGWSFDTQPHGYNHTLWIPLESVTLRNSPIAITPWRLGRFVSPQELGLAGFFAAKAHDPDVSRTEYKRYQAGFRPYVRQQQPDCVVPQLDPGDLVVFASLTPHASMPPQWPSSRAAVQVLIRDSRRRWASWEQQMREGTTNGPDEPRDRLQVVNARWRMVMAR